MNRLPGTSPSVSARSKEDNASHEETHRDPDGGGDVPPLNAVIGAAQRAAAEEKIGIVGFLHGWNGVLESDFVDLEKVHIDPRVGGTILKSSRVNIARAEDGISRAFSNLERAAPDGLIVIGGEDTLSNVFHLGSHSRK